MAVGQRTQYHQLTDCCRTNPEPVRDLNGLIGQTQARPGDRDENGDELMLQARYTLLQRSHSSDLLMLKERAEMQAVQSQLILRVLSVELLIGPGPC